MLLVMIATSSTHRRHVELVSILVWVVHLALFISLLISSISVAYWVTASTPPCLIDLCCCWYLWVLSCRAWFWWWLLGSGWGSRLDSMLLLRILVCSLRTCWRRAMLCHMLLWRLGMLCRCFSCLFCCGWLVLWFWEYGHRGRNSLKKTLAHAAS